MFAFPLPSAVFVNVIRILNNNVIVVAVFIYLLSRNIVSAIIVHHLLWS